MTPYNPGDVVLIPFPFTDFSTFKQRPAVILSSPRFNRAGDDVIVAAITSHLVPHKGIHEYRLTSAEQRAAGLPKPSSVKLSKVVTLDQRLIRKQIGTLPVKVTQRLLADFQKIFND